MSERHTRNDTDRPLGAWLSAVALGAPLWVCVGGCYGGASGSAGADSLDATGETGTGDDTAGDTGSTGETTGSTDGDPLGCGEDASVAPLRRLSEAQYRNTLRDLFAPAGIDVDAVAQNELARIPADDAGTSFTILDARVSAQHARAYYLLADRMGTLAVATDQDLAGLAGSCAMQASPTTECIDAFLADFAARAYRRPLTAAESERYRAMQAGASSSAEFFRTLVLSILLSPQFLYHVEVAGEGDDQRFELDSYSLASRLSFHFWQTMPDAELFEAARNGSLLTEAGYNEQLDRVFEDPRTKTTVDRFYDEWLRLSWLTQFPTTPAFETFAEGTTVADADADHLAAAQAEIHALTRYYTWEQDGSLADLYLSDISLTQSPHLAALYGVDPWDGQSSPPRMPEGQRAGLLTRMAFLVTGDHETHPVHRGAAVRRRILCEDLPSPNPASLPPGSLDPPPVTVDQTTRERYEAKTADASCVACHVLINPPGFILEQYDALGRYRTEERVIDEATGDVLATLPIDASAAPMLDGTAEVLASGPELSAAVVASGRAEACFAQQYFAATFGRTDVAEDACAVEAVEEALLDGESVREALRTIALAPVFRARRVD